MFCTKVGDTTSKKAVIVVTDVFAEDGGELLNWNLDICYAGSLPIFIDGAISNVSCFGGEDGSIDLSIENGSGNYSFLWSTGVSTQTISVDTSGLYWVEVTDMSGTTRDSIIVDIYSLPVLINGPSDSTYCQGNVDLIALY